jgi:hypothetical protein
MSTLNDSNRTLLNRQLPTRQPLLTSDCHRYAIGNYWSQETSIEEHSSAWQGSGGTASLSLRCARRGRVRLAPSVKLTVYQLSSLLRLLSSAPITIQLKPGYQDRQ